MKFGKNDTSNADERKKKIIIMSIVIAILILSLLGVYVRLGIISLPGTGNNVEPAAQITTDSDDTSEVTEQLDIFTEEADEQTSETKEEDISSEDDTNVLSPFSGPFELIGVVVDQNNKNVAIIDGNSRTHIVRQNDLIDDSWKVQEISKDSVILNNNGNMFKLTIR